MTKFSRLLFPLLGTLTLLPAVPAPLALVAGVFISLTLGNPYWAATQKLVPLLLGISIVGLGAGSDLGVIATVGAHGVAYTLTGITLTMLLGIGLAKLLNLERNLAVLLSVGTAICGGSAIAAVAPALGAKSTDVSVALATVFLLNALALLIFPWIGHNVGLDENAFGHWSALAIHDTSSVVGASLQYGKHALEVATTLKLVRALWIIPVTLIIGLLWGKDSAQPSTLARLKRMWFIPGFVMAAALVTWIPELRGPGAWVVAGAKRCFVLTLFLIGSSLTPTVLRNVGARALFHGFVLWAIVATATLKAIMLGWIR